MASPDFNTTAQSADSLLALLKDIHPAESASWWPPAPGWWILAFVSAVLLWWLGNKLFKAWKRYRFKLMVKAMLAALFQQHADQPRELLVELNQLFKRWLGSQGIQGVQHLAASDWAAYLQSDMAVSEAEKTVIETLASAQYQSLVPDYDIELLKAWSQRWLNSREMNRG